MKTGRRKNLFLVIIALVIIAVFLGYFIKANLSLKKSAQSGELKKVKSSELNPKGLEEYYKTYKNPFVVYLRKALNAYLANDSSNINIAVAAVTEARREGIISGLDSFDKEYYKSKFVVLTFTKNIAGGVDIQIMFQDKLDRIFYAWVYKLAGGNYELRGFNSKEYFDPMKIKELNNAYKQFLLDKEHSL